MGSERKHLCTVCLESFAERDLILYAGHYVCAPCAERKKVAPHVVGERLAAQTASASERMNPGQNFGREIYRCLAEDDVEKFRLLFLTDDETALALGDAGTAAHATLIRGRSDRDFRSKRAYFFKEGPFEFLEFRLGGIEEGNREVQRYGRSTLRYKSGELEKKLIIQRIYRVRGAYKLEFFE